MPNRPRCLNRNRAQGRSSDRLGFGALGVCLLTLHAPAALAQSLPPAAEPGRLEQELRPLPQPQSKPRPRALEPVRIEPSALDLQVRLRLQGIELVGNEAIDTEALADLWQARLGQAVNLGDLKGIARQITSRYRNAGYILSQALVPPQEVNNGVVRIEVAEGFVDRVQAEADRALTGTLADYAAHIPASRPLQVRHLERWLLLMNDLPGLSAQSVFRPSPQAPDAADLTLKTQRIDYAGQWALNNRAGAYYQDWVTDLSASVYNPLGWDEGWFVRAALAGDAAAGDDGGYRNLNLGFGLPLGGRGLKLDIAFDHTASKPGHDIAGLGYEGGSETLRLQLEYPFERSRERSLYARLGFDYADSGLDLQDTVINDDRLRVVRAGLRLDWAVDAGLNLLQLQASAGLDLFGASAAGDANLSRAAGDGAFFKLGLDWVYLRPLWQDAQLRIDLQGQISDRKLLSAEEFGLGGARLGRGYDGSEITGDRGAGLGLELAQGLPHDLQAYGFYDIGRVSDKTGGDQSLASAGGGLRFSYQKYITGQLELAVPLTRPLDAADPGEEHDWRLFLSLSAGF